MKTKLDLSRLLTNAEIEQTLMSCNRRARLTFQQVGLFCFKEETRFNLQYLHNHQLSKGNGFLTSKRTCFQNSALHLTVH